MEYGRPSTPSLSALVIIVKTAGVAAGVAVGIGVPVGAGVAVGMGVTVAVAVAFGPGAAMPVPVDPLEELFELALPITAHPASMEKASGATTNAHNQAPHRRSFLYFKILQPSRMEVIVSEYKSLSSAMPSKTSRNSTPRGWDYRVIANICEQIRNTQIFMRLLANKYLENLYTRLRVRLDSECGVLIKSYIRRQTGTLLYDLRRHAHRGSARGN